MTAAVRVLGTVAVTREGTELPLSPQRRLLLALLVARFPHPVSSDRLIDDLWDGSPPPSAATALRVHITHLRRAIAGCDGTIDYRAGQFSLNLTPETIDAQVLLRDAAIAERAIAERRFTDAAGLGDGFVQIQPAFGPWSAHAALSGPAETLDAAQRSLIQSTSLALIGCGRASTALTVAERLAAADPYDERSACIMLVALAALGRGTEALRRLDVVRRSLADDIGALIGPQMRDVESALLDGLDAFDVLLPGPPDGPVAPYGAPGVDRAAAAVPALVRPFEHPLLDEFFVGRDVELKRCATALAASGFVGIAGEPGIGRSTVAARVASADEGAVLFVACRATDRAPLGALRRALQATDPSDVLLRSWLDGRLASDRETDHVDVLATLTERIVKHLVRSGIDSPLLVIDDFHHADRATRALVVDLVSGRRADVVATWRGGATDGPADVLAEAAGCGVATVVELGPLRAGDIEALVAPGGLPAGVSDIAALHRLTGGNPSLVRVCVDTLRGGDPITGLVGGSATWVDDRLGKLVDTVSPAGRRLLDVAAVAGSPFALDHLVASALVPVDTLLGALDEVVGRDLLRADPSGVDHWVFRHGLLQRWLSESLEWHEAALVRRELARTLRGDDAESWAARAELLTLAAPVVTADERAAVVGQAVAATLALGTPADAARMFALAPSTTGDPAASAHVELATARIEAAVGRTEPARAAFKRSVAAALVAGRAEVAATAAAEHLGPWIRRWEVDSASVALIEHTAAAVAHLDDPVAAARLRAAAARASYFGSDRGSAAAAAAEALGLARAIGDRDTLIEAMRTMLLVTAGPTQAHRRRALADEAALLAAGHPSLPRVLADLAAARLAVGDVAGARQAVAELNEHGAIWASPVTCWEAAVISVALAIGDGDAEAVHSGTATVRDLGGTAGIAEAAGTAATQRFVMRWWAGRLRGTAAAHTAAEGFAASAAPVWRAAHSLAAIADGDLPTAARLLTAVVGELHVVPDYLWTAAAVFATRAAHVLDDRPAAEALLALLEPCDAVIAMVGDATAVLGPLDRWRAELAATLGRRDGVVRLRARANDVVASTGMRAWAPGAGPPR